MNNSHFTFSIVGAGRLGKTMAALLLAKTHGKLLDVCNQSLGSSQDAVAFLGAGTAKTMDSMNTVDVILLAVPDDRLSECALELAKTQGMKPHTIIIHFSGCLSSQVLYPLEEKGCQTGSIHPLRSFADSQLSISQFPGTFCAVESQDESSKKYLEDLVLKIGGRPFVISSDKKALYHASAVFASNYVVTLCHEATKGFEESGIPYPMALDMTLEMMKGALKNIQELTSPEKALTGPLKRGDHKTIQSHVAALSDPELYQVLGKSTLQLVNTESL